MKKTTKKHFEMFEDECLYWIKKFGLQHWGITIVHGVTSNDYHVAECRYNYASRHAIVTLQEDWSKSDIIVTGSDNYAICQLAYHEILHLLLAPLREYGIDSHLSKEQSQYEYNIQEHKVVMTLVNSDFNADYNLRFKK